MDKKEKSNKLTPAELGSRIIFGREPETPRPQQAGTHNKTDEKKFESKQVEKKNK